MQGNCGDMHPNFTPAPGTAPLRSLLPGQCLLLADNTLLNVVGSTWLHGLYVRLTILETGEFNSLILGEPDPTAFTQNSVTGPRLWMTEVTLQGNGDGVRDCHACGLFFWGLVFAQGAVIVPSHPRHACMHQPGHDTNS